MADQKPFAGMAQEATLIETLAELSARLAQISNTLAMLQPDQGGRLRVTLETGSATANTTLGAVNAVNSCASVTNLTQVGGLAANQHMIAMLLGSEADLRRNIVIS